MATMLKLVAKYSGSFYEEKLTHKFFNGCRFNNEWYKISKSDIDNFISFFSGFNRSSISEISIKHFDLIDYKLWDYISNEKEMFFSINHKEVSHIISERAFFYSKKKLIELGLITKVGNKKYAVNINYI